MFINVLQLINNLSRYICLQGSNYLVSSSSAGQVCKTVYLERKPFSMVAHTRRPKGGGGSSGDFRRMPPRQVQQRRPVALAAPTRSSGQLSPVQEGCVAHQGITVNFEVIQYQT
jgi:hypothetical protein